jgi:hypothetical protein
MVLSVSIVFLTALKTMAAARVSSPEVGSSMKIIEGLETNPFDYYRRKENGETYPLGTQSIWFLCLAIPVKMDGIMRGRCTVFLRSRKMVLREGDEQSD